MQIPLGGMFKAIGCESPHCFFYPQKKVEKIMKKPDLQNNTTLRLRSFGLNFDVFLPNPKSPWNSHPHPPETLQWAVAIAQGRQRIHPRQHVRHPQTSQMMTNVLLGAIWNIDLHEHVKKNIYIYIYILYICWSDPTPTLWTRFEVVWVVMSRVSRKMVDENHPVELRMPSTLCDWAVGIFTLSTLSGFCHMKHL